VGAVEDALNRLGEMADELGFDDDEKKSFIDGMMEKRGFQRISSWAEPDGGGSGDKNVMPWQPRQGTRERRPATGGQRSGGFTQYSG
jgi:hypothetical protein